MRLAAPYLSSRSITKVVCRPANRLFLGPSAQSVGLACPCFGHRLHDSFATLRSAVEIAETMTVCATREAEPSFSVVEQACSSTKGIRERLNAIVAVGRHGSDTDGVETARQVLRCNSLPKRTVFPSKKSQKCQTCQMPMKNGKCELEERQIVNSMLHGPKRRGSRK